MSRHRQSLDSYLFQDPFELDHVLGLLDEWAKCPPEVSLEHEVSGEDSPIRQAIGRLVDLVVTTEKANGVPPGDSYQAHILMKLDDLLWGAKTAPDLEAELPRIKKLLRVAQNIADGLLIDNMRPDAARGRKQLEGGIEGHKRAHGTEEEKKERWEAMQKTLEETMRCNPNLSVTRAREIVAKKMGCAFITVRRHTSDPRKK